MQITKHFTLDEMIASQTAARNGLDNMPGSVAMGNLRRLCEVLELVREAIARPIIISSGYRSPEVNKLVGGSTNSQHRLGCAADIIVPGLTPEQAMNAIVAARLPYDQLIREYDAWVHYSVPNTALLPWRKQALIIDRKGIRAWPSPS